MISKKVMLVIVLGPVLWVVVAGFAFVAMQFTPRTTCAQTEDEQDFDLVVEYIAADQTDTLVTTNLEVRVSGEDYHSLLAIDGEEGKEEYLVKDGRHYLKRVGGEWEHRDDPVSGLGFIWYMIDSRPHYMQLPSEHILCPIEGEDFRAQKFWFDETIPGAVYSWEHDWESYPWLDPIAAAELTDIRARWEYWPNMEGHIYKSRQILEPVGGEEWERVEITTDISEVGVPNVITAPVVQ